MYWGANQSSVRAQVIARNFLAEAAARGAANRIRQYKTATRVELGVQAHQKGNIALASQHFSRALHSRSLPLPVRQKIVQALEEYMSQGRAELQDAMDKVDSIVATSRSQRVGLDASFGNAFIAEKNSEIHESVPYVDDPTSHLRNAIQDVVALQRKFKNVPKIQEEIEEAVEHLKSGHEGVAKILYEPLAAELAEQARAMEANGEICCAYFAYQQAAAFLPCETAKLARRRADALAKLPSAQQEIDRCRAIRKLQERFDLAMRLATDNQSEASRILGEIATEAPAKSGVKKAAELELQRLNG